MLSTDIYYLQDQIYEEQSYQKKQLHQRHSTGIIFCEQSSIWTVYEGPAWQGLVTDS